MKRTLALFLAALLLTASCSQAPAAQEETESSPTSIEIPQPEEPAAEETELHPDIPEGYTFNGASFTIMYNDYPVPGWTQHDIDAEETNGTTINDAVFNRNTKVESVYDCEIIGYRVSYSDLFAEIPRLVKASDDSVDIATPLFWQGKLSDLALGGNFRNLREIDTIHFEQPWYDQQSVENFTIFGKTYFVVCDMTIGDRLATAGIVFNKQLYENYQYNSTYGNIYDLVREGKWTHSLFSDMILSLSNDVNGDGKMTDQDFYGLLYQRDSLPSFINSYGMMMAQPDDEGVPTYTLISEENANKLDAMLDTLYHQDNCFHVMNWFDKTSTDFTTGMTNMFSANQGMFMWIRFADVEMLRTMDVDFGIIPVPKWDEAQENYYSTVNQHMGIATVILNSNSKPEETGTLLEALACESKKVLIPAYYDISLQGKISRDEESTEMLDIIFGNRVYDTGFIFNIGGFGQQIYALTQTYDRDYATIWARGQRMYDKSMERFIDQWQKIGE